MSPFPEPHIDQVITHLLPATRSGYLQHPLSWCLLLSGYFEKNVHSFTWMHFPHITVVTM